MEQLKIPFGTPAPICYKESDQISGLSLEVKCKIHGFVIVSEYPPEYEDEVSLRTAVKETALRSLEDYLQNSSKTDNGRLFFPYKQRDTLLEKAIEDAVSEKGIRAEATIANFAIVDPTEKEIKDLLRQHMPMGTVYAGPDQMPYITSTMLAYAGPAQMVYAGPAPGNPGIGMMFTMQQQMEAAKAAAEKKDESAYRICPECGQRCLALRFCSECGKPLT